MAWGDTWVNTRIGSWLVAIVTTALCMVAMPQRLEAGESGAYLLKQWNTTVPVVRSSCPSVLGNAGGRVVFLATTPQEGYELWSTDGTADGTTLLKEMIPGVGGHTAYELKIRGRCSGRLFLSVVDGDTGVTWWSTDGTGEGTWKIEGLPAPVNDNEPSEFFEYGGTTYGTVLGGIYEIDIPLHSATQIDERQLGKVLGVSGSRVVYSAYDPTTPNPEIWSFDLETGEYSAVKDLIAGASSQAFAIWSGPVELGRGVLFDLLDSSNAKRYLAISDGTAENTVILTEVNSPVGIGDVAGCNSEQAYIQSGKSIWFTDGTIGGTRLVHESATANYYGLGRESSAILNGRLISQFYSGSNNPPALWTSDGTQEGTRPFFAGTPPFKKGFSPGPVIDGMLYFTARRDTSPYLGLWVTDGTEAGTVKLRDFSGTSVDAACGSAMDGPEAAMLSDGRFVFTGCSLTEGSEPWVSDGTPENTRLLKNISPESFSSSPQLWAKANGLAFLLARSGVATSLVRTDGTPEGSFSLMDKAPTAWGIGIGSHVLFMHHDSSVPVPNYSLYRTDGTIGGTIPIQSTLNGRKIRSADSAFGDGRKACFWVYTVPDVGQVNSDLRLEGWLSDGGVGEVTQFASTPRTTYITSSYGAVQGKALGEHFYYTITAGTGGAFPPSTFWRSDGTTSGTVSMLPGNLNPSPGTLLAWDQKSSSHGSDQTISTRPCRSALSHQETRSRPC